MGRIAVVPAANVKGEGDSGNNAGTPPMTKMISTVTDDGDDADAKWKKEKNKNIKKALKTTR